MWRLGISDADRHPAPALPATQTPTATATVVPASSRFVDNGDGTVTDTMTALMWEKKDSAGGLHDANDSYPWAGFCSISGVPCQSSASAATGVNRYRVFFDHRVHAVRRERRDMQCSRRHWFPDHYDLGLVGAAQRSELRRAQ